MSTSNATIFLHHDGLREAVGSGRWTGTRFEECTADLGDDVYAAIDDALYDLDGKPGTVEITVGDETYSIEVVEG